MSNPVCRVSWCVSGAKPGAEYCVLHLRMPLKHSWEKQHEWMIRIRAEAKEAKKQREQAAREAANQADKDRRHGAR